MLKKHFWAVLIILLIILIIVSLNRNRCIVCLEKTDFFARATHPKSYIANCLHLALFACTALIISLLRSVGNLVFCLHAVCTICTYLHGVCTYLHGVCPLLYTSVSVCMIGYATYTFWHRGSDFLVRATETTASRYCITALALTWRHAAVAAERWWCLRVGKCR